MQLLAGLALDGATSVMLVLAGLGLDPWDVLHQGLARTFGLPLGTWAIIVSFVVLLGWVPLHQRPGVATIANAALVGLVIDLTLAVFHPPHAAWLRVGLLCAGITGNGLATGLYIGAGLGPGARDGLSTAIAARAHSMRAVRTGIEATVLLAGFLLGGSVGVGTALAQPSPAAESRRGERSQTARWLSDGPGDRIRDEARVSPRSVQRSDSVERGRTARP